MENNERLLELMEEMVKLQKLMAMPTIRKLVEETLDKPEKMYVYEMTDGIITREKIILETGASAGAISSWWNDWFSKGLLVKESTKYKKIFSLKDLGIPLPALKKKVKSKMETIDEGMDNVSKGETENE